jgi:hypothetical protein
VSTLDAIGCDCTNFMRFIHGLLNVLVHFANKMGLQKNLNCYLHYKETIITLLNYFLSCLVNYNNKIVTLILNSSEALFMEQCSICIRTVRYPGN